MSLDEEPDYQQEILHRFPPIWKSSCLDEAYLEDGPLFRATIKQLEDRTADLRISLKRIIKSATTSLEVQGQLSDADDAYFNALRDTPCIEPFMTQFLSDAFKTIQEERRRLGQSLSTQLIEPLRKLYENDIKAADMRKRQFEEESREYYVSLAKYLKHSNKLANSQQHQIRKSKFDLARFDYLNFLLGLHGGKKENEILFCIADHTVRHVNYFETIATKTDIEKKGLNKVFLKITDDSREQELAAQEREKKREALVARCNLSVDQEKAEADKFLNEEVTVEEIIAESPTKFTAVNINTISSQENPLKNIRDILQTSSVVVEGRRKEGFLFTTAKPSKSTGAFDVASNAAIWRKYWCVLSNGQLHEYSNWKKQLESHIDPINLTLATVRKARHPERRFCFEVITPHLRRVYQATSEEEAQSWIGTINNSIKGVLSGTGSAIDLSEFNGQIPVAPILPRRHRRSISGAFRSGLAAVTGTNHNGSSNLVISPSKSTPVKLKKGPLSNEIQAEMPLPPVPPPKSGPILSISSATTSNLSLQTPSSPITSIFSSSATSVLQKLPGSRPTSSLFQVPLDNLESSFSVPTQTEKHRWSGFSIGSFSFDKKDKDSGSVKSMPFGNHQLGYASVADSEVNLKLLAILKQDPSNHFCVDCNARNPEWCSLNLGVLLCIECSGIHRSLGTHVSKVRSLNMDTTSYTLDIIELLNSIGNARANDIWDVRIKQKSQSDMPRPGPYESRAVKIAYIQAKYVGHKFVQPTETDPNQILFDAIDADDIPKALLALASGADVNATRPKGTLLTATKERKSSLNKQQKVDDMPQNALCCALLRSRLVTEDHVLSELKEVVNPTIVSNDHVDLNATSSSAATTIKRIFPMAELLLQHNADTSVVNADLVLDDQVLDYINAKNTARGQSKITRTVSNQLQTEEITLDVHQQELQHLVPIIMADGI